MMVGSLLHLHRRNHDKQIAATFPRIGLAAFKKERFMMNRKNIRHIIRDNAGHLGAALLLLPQQAYAAGAGMPWEGPLEQILNSLAGPVARAIGVAAIIVTGLGIAFGEGGGGMRKMLWVVFGLTIAFSATSFFLSFFGGASGAAF